MDNARHYAVRRVNPFDGVLQVVEIGGARAYSPDGSIWQIQVLAQRPDHTWRSFADVAPIEQYFNFGLWDTQGGMHRVPANPIMDIGAMTDAADRLASVLLTLYDRVPFPLVDHYECWSTDHRGDPVALLATSEDPGLIGQLRVGRWHASRLSDHGFVSVTLLDQGIPSHGELGPRQHAEQLERQVRKHGQHRAWFQRGTDASAAPWPPKPDATPETTTPLPPLGLKTDWDDRQMRSLVQDFLAWQAPRLLMLQGIDDKLRAWLETMACRQAVELAAGYRLLPRILDRPRLEAARVEARLRRTSA